MPHHPPAKQHIFFLRACAEQVVSEAHSAIVILDSRGNIQRFNRLCEDYTGLKEHDVIG